MNDKYMSDEYIGYYFLFVLFVGLGLFLYFQNRAPDSPPPRWTGSLEALPTIEDLEIDMDKVVLGRRLYHDGILSGDGSVSCASCHNVAAGGAEPRRTSFGMNNAVGPINSPTTLNAWNHIAQFWDGRAADLQEQAGGPVENPGEMGATFNEVVPRIEGDEWYASHFADVYPEEGVTKNSITDAIAEYERALLTPGPFDAWLAGDDEAMSEEAVAGYRLFEEVGCTTCHQGAAVGGTMFMKMGLVHNYFEERGGELTEADMGRFNHTGDEAHRHHFKVPTLRNIALTAPYFHDGSEDDLGNAVRTMAHVQLGRELEDAEVASIVSFMNELTGELPEYALVPDAEMPPERSYELPLAYDIRVAKRLDGTVYLSGVVPSEEAKTALVARVSAKAGSVNADGLIVNDNTAYATPESFDATIDVVLDALAPMTQARADFDFSSDGEDGAKMSFVGEGDEAAMANANALFAAAPDGFEWSTPTKLYDAAAAAACDERLTTLQAQTRLEFNTGSAELSAASTAMLRGVPNLLNGCPDGVRVHVTGHTDNVGDPSTNLRLSRNRAASVVDVLVNAGVGAGQVVSHGYGETKPLADNESDEGRSQNRRIDLALYREF
ncbi:MAG: cytochrome c peroxidase [Polyangiales bacterium]|jgi:cytochrome c peroxidase